MFQSCKQAPSHFDSSPFSTLRGGSNCFNPASRPQAISTNRILNPRENRWLFQSCKQAPSHFDKLLVLQAQSDFTCFNPASRPQAISTRRNRTTTPTPRTCFNPASRPQAISTRYMRSANFCLFSVSILQAGPKPFRPPNQKGECS